jgi:glucokinase
MRIGIDIGGSKTRIAYERGGELHPFHRGPTPQDPAAAVRAIVAAVRAARLPRAPAALGVGCPGPLDLAAGLVLSPPNLPRWDRFPLAAELRSALGVPVVLENDANAGALGEATRGAARGFPAVLYVTLGTGLGVGIVFGGRVHHGAFGLAGEVWAFPPAAFDGAPGDNLTSLCSANGLVLQAERRLRAGRASALPRDGLTAPAILRAFAAGDALAVEVVELARRALAAALCFSLHLLAPDIVVLGGGLCRDESWFVAPLRERVRAQPGLAALRQVPVRRAALWNEAVLWGAIELAGEAAAAEQTGMKRQFAAEAAK